MEELTYETKIAIIRILSEIMKADNIIRESEANYLGDVVKSFNLGDNWQTDEDNMLTMEALSVIGSLTMEQKERVAQMMGKMIVVDKDINYNEVKMYSTFCKSCGINREFDVDQYPEYALSRMSPFGSYDSNIVNE